MNKKQVKDHANFLAFAASIRVLAMQASKVAAPNDPEGWFNALGQKTFEYVDGSSNPYFREPDLKAIKEETYRSLRMIFDAKGFKV